MPKPKRVVESDSDSDSGPEDRGPAKKKLATSAPSKSTEKKSDDEGGLALGKNKFVTVREFRGSVYIDIREFYEDKNSGELKPGKKGISLNAQQYQKLKELLPEIDEKLSKM